MRREDRKDDKMRRTVADLNQDDTLTRKYALHANETRPCDKRRWRWSGLQGIRCRSDEAVVVGRPVKQEVMTRNRSCQDSSLAYHCTPHTTAPAVFENLKQKDYYEQPTLRSQTVKRRDGFEAEAPLHRKR